MTFGSIALIAAAGVGGYVIFSSPDSSGTPAIATSTQTASDTSSTTYQSSTTTATESSAANATYKDGTYSAEATYVVPHDSNSINVTVTVSGGKITSVKTDDSYSDHESAMYVSDFESEVSSDATGQDIASYSPSRIGGASLTTEGFASALDTIRSDAKG